MLGTRLGDTLARYVWGGARFKPNGFASAPTLSTVKRGNSARITPYGQKLGYHSGHCIIGACRSHGPLAPKTVRYGLELELMTLHVMSFGAFTPLDDGCVQGNMGQQMAHICDLHERPVQVHQGGQDINGGDHTNGSRADWMRARGGW